MKMIRTLGLMTISQLFVISSVSFGQEYSYRVYFADLSTEDLLKHTDIRYDADSPVVAMTAYQGGVLTAFARHAGGENYVIHWSPDGENLGNGPIRYLAGSPVEAMIVYKGGVLTAFSKAGTHGHRIHWSPDGNDLGNGPIRYDAGSPVVAMIAYEGGVLTAFARHAGGENHVIHWSPDGENLGNGPIRYLAGSPVEAMIAYKGGVLTAFSKAGPHGHRIHWSPDGNDLGDGPIRYDAGSPVVAMTEYQGDVLTAFAKHHGRDKYVIHSSKDGHHLGGLTSDPERNIRYLHTWPVVAMTPYKNGVLVAVQYPVPKDDKPPEARPTGCDGPVFDGCQGDACSCASIDWNGSCYELANNCDRGVTFVVGSPTSKATVDLRPGETKVLHCFGGCCQTITSPYCAKF